MAMRHMGKSAASAVGLLGKFFISKKETQGRNCFCFSCGCCHVRIHQSKLDTHQRMVTYGDEQVQEKHREGEQNQKHAVPAAQLNTAPLVMR